MPSGVGGKHFFHAHKFRNKTLEDNFYIRRYLLATYKTIDTNQFNFTRYRNPINSDIIPSGLRHI